MQCNEDNIERDTQTDEADIADKWTQHPPETSVACGGDEHGVTDMQCIYIYIYDVR